MALQLTLGMSWSVDATGNTFKLLITVISCLLLLGAARIGSELGDRAGLVAALFVASYPEFWIHQTLGAVDLAVAAFLIFGTIWWIDALRRQHWTEAILAGVAFGFALASRYQGIVLVSWLLMTVFVAEWLRNHKIVRRHLLQGLAVIAIIAVMTAPWLLRNYAFFGNPVFPLLHVSLGGGEWSAEQAGLLVDEVMGPSLFNVPAQRIVLAPVNALLMYPHSGVFGIGLLFASLLAGWLGSRDVRLYALLGIGGLVIWGLLHPVPGVQLLRFNAASLALLLSCTGAILGSDRLQALKGTFVAVVWASCSLVIAIVNLQSIVPVWQTLVSTPLRTQYWQANVPSWQTFEIANQHLDPTRDKILLIGETRALWLTVPFLAPSSFNGPQLTEVFSSAAEPNIWAGRLHQLGVTHILICSSEWQRLADTKGYFRLSDDHLSRFLAWLHRLPVLFDDHRGNVLLVVPH
jgi:hypothetical protein